MFWDRPDQSVAEIAPRIDVVTRIFRTVSTIILAKLGYFLYTPFDEFPELVRLFSRCDFKH